MVSNNLINVKPVAAWRANEHRHSPYSREIRASSGWTRDLRRQLDDRLAVNPIHAAIVDNDHPLSLTAFEKSEAEIFLILVRWPGFSLLIRENT